MLAVFLTLINDDDRDDRDDRDQRFFEKLYMSYRSHMYSVAFSILKESSLAEDAVHDTFLRIAAKHIKMLESIENEQDRRNYLLKATRNTSINILNKNKCKTICNNMYMQGVLGVPDLSDDDFVESICTRNDYKQVILAMSTLDHRYSDVLYYHFVMELTVAEVAKLQEKSINTVKKQLVRGKKLLLSELERINYVNDKT